ncbi:MAG: SurA N-terminal domain-containing protein, partial [Pseudomonadota bacterium]
MRFRGFAVFAIAGAVALASGGCSLLKRRTAAPAPRPAPAVANSQAGARTAMHHLGALTGPNIRSPQTAQTAAISPAPEVPPTASGLTIDRVIATVDGNPITMADVEAFSAAAGKPVPAQAGPARNLAIRKALKATIEERMLEEEVKKYQDKVDDHQVDRYVNEIKRRSGMSDGQFNAELQKHGMTMAVFRKNARMQLERAEMIQGEVRGKINISDARIAAYY